MRIDLHCHIEIPPEVLDRLDGLSRKLDLVLKSEIYMSKELDDLTAQVKSNSEVEASALTLINGIAARITAASTDPAALKALTDELKAKDDQLAAAVTANTPAA